MLADLKAMFYRQEEPAEALTSTEILQALHELEDRPWSEWSRTGKPITVFQVANLLAPLKIKPKQVWIAGKNQRGYRHADLARAFAHYLPPELPPSEASPGLRDPRKPPLPSRFRLLGKIKS